MQRLKCTRDEAENIYFSDLAIDKMTMKEINADLTQEQAEAIIKMKNVGRKVSSEKKSRERKPDELKETLISLINEFVASLDMVDTSEIINKNREIKFSASSQNFTLTLVKKKGGS